MKVTANTIQRNCQLQGFTQVKQKYKQMTYIRSKSDKGIKNNNKKTPNDKLKGSMVLEGSLTSTTNNSYELAYKSKAKVK